MPFKMKAMVCSKISNSVLMFLALQLKVGSLSPVRTFSWATTHLSSPSSAILKYKTESSTWATNARMTLVDVQLDTLVGYTPAKFEADRPNGLGVITNRNSLKD